MAVRLPEEPVLPRGLKHRAVIHGEAHLSPRGRGRVRLEAQGLFTRRAVALGGGRLEPGLYRVHLWFRTDLEGLVAQVAVPKRELLAQVPVGFTPGVPLRFFVLGEWLGAEEGVGRVRVVPAKAPAFVVSFLAVRPHPLPPAGNLVAVFGRVERGRLLGEMAVAAGWT